MGQGDYNIDLPEGVSFAPSADRVAAVAAMLRPGTFHLGRPGTDRAAWEPIRDHDVGRQILLAARATLTPQPLPRLSDEIYLSCLRDHSPAAFNLVAPEVRARMCLLPVAECLEPTGAYLDVIEHDIAHTLRLRSWTHPNNDNGRQTFDGDTIFNDLASLHTASLLVAADFLLGDRLLSETRRAIRQQVQRRTLDPFRQRIESGQDVYWWVTVTHNWNSVCLLHTVACALALQEEAHDRAWFVALAEDLIRFSEKGFTDSGFYTEGVGYWSYGFGCYTILAEIVRSVTGGTVDWLSRERVQRVASFGSRMEVQQGVFPSFADCRRDLVLPNWLVHWMNNRDDPGDRPRVTDIAVDPLGGLVFGSSLTALLVLFHQQDVRQVYARRQQPGLRDWFADVQFLICRPHQAAQVQLASTFKGGNNGVNHNHNDLGTFTVLVDDCELLTDPGAEVYTERTFSRQRYESDLLNSYGHPVPVVAGQLQVPDKQEYTVGVGQDVSTTVLETHFGTDEDRVVMDLRGAYRVATLQKLIRTFTHSRAGDGVIEVVDEVAFAQPEAFATALITYAAWRERADGSLRIGDDGAAIDVRVTSATAELVFEHCRIEESSTPMRLSWRLLNPALSATVQITVTPVI
jgi:hypothetical protein